MAELDGRVALVTGASGGIGAAAARALAEAGAKLLLTDLAAPDTLAASLGGLATAHDVTSEADWERVVALAKEKAGGLDILVNNAGLFLSKPLLETSLEEWKRIHAVNVEGVFLGCKAAVPILAERAQRWAGGASIINLSSVAGLVGSAGVTCYNASKGAVRLFTKGLALELAPQSIRVNSIHPGVIDTRMGDQVVAMISGGLGLGDNEAREQTALLHPLGHLGKPEDIANGIVFLASDRAAFMTGSELVIDGGYTAR